MSEKEVQSKKEKVSITFRLDRDLHDRFAAICRDNAINQSAWLRRQIEKFIAAFGEIEEEDNRGRKLDGGQARRT